MIYFTLAKHWYKIIVNIFVYNTYYGRWLYLYRLLFISLRSFTILSLLYRARFFAQSRNSLDFPLYFVLDSSREKLLNAGFQKILSKSVVKQDGWLFTHIRFSLVCQRYFGRWVFVFGVFANRFYVPEICESDIFVTKANISRKWIFYSVFLFNFWLVKK